MKVTKKTLEEAILFFAAKYCEEKSYKALLESWSGTPKVINMIVYDMFINKFNSYHCSAEEYENYKLIYEYAAELKEKGFVEFGK
jgi:hypothetical protein